MIAQAIVDKLLEDVFDAFHLGTPGDKAYVGGHGTMRFQDGQTADWVILRFFVGQTKKRHVEHYFRVENHTSWEGKQLIDFNLAEWAPFKIDTHSASPPPTAHP